jgi:hypothetical protein
MLWTSAACRLSTTAVGPSAAKANLLKSNRKQIAMRIMVITSGRRYTPPANLVICMVAFAQKASANSQGSDAASYPWLRF